MPSKVRRAFSDLLAVRLYGGDVSVCGSVKLIEGDQPRHKVAAGILQLLFEGERFVHGVFLCRKCSIGAPKCQAFCPQPYT